MKLEMLDNLNDDEVRAILARGTQLLEQRLRDRRIKKLEGDIVAYEELGLDPSDMKRQLAKLNGASKPKKEPAANGFKGHAGHRYGLKGNADFKWDCVRGGVVPKAIREAKPEDIQDKGPIPKDEAKPDQSKAA